MFRVITLLSVLCLCTANANAVEDSNEPPPCGETDFSCIQERETARFQTQIDSQKEAWLGHWEDAKERGIEMFNEHKEMACADMGGVELMQCRVASLKKLKEWKAKHEEKKDEYLERINTLKAKFLDEQQGEDSLWSKVKNDYSEKALAIKDKLLNNDTVSSILGPLVSGQSLEGRVNAALTQGAAGAAAGAARFISERAAHFNTLRIDRDSCRSATAVGACLTQVGVDHDAWKQEFDIRRAQAEEIAQDVLSE